jgi:hypothetical protein
LFQPLQQQPKTKKKIFGLEEYVLEAFLIKCDLVVRIAS